MAQSDSPGPGPGWHAAGEYGLALTREQRAAVHAAWEARERADRGEGHAGAMEKAERACMDLGVTSDGVWVRDVDEAIPGRDP